MCACVEPVGTAIGAVCVEYGRPKWSITMLNHTHCTEECFVLYFWHPMLVRPAMKRLFFPWKTKEKKARFARAPHERPFVTHTGLTVKTALFLFVLVTHSSSMKGPRLNFHVERELAGRTRRPPFFIISPTTEPPRTSSSCCLSLIKEVSYTHTVLRYRYCTLL